MKCEIAKSIATNKRCPKCGISFKRGVLAYQVRWRYNKETLVCHYCVAGTLINKRIKDYRRKAMNAGKAMERYGVPLRYIDVVKSSKALNKMFLDATK